MITARERNMSAHAAAIIDKVCSAGKEGREVNGWTRDNIRKHTDKATRHIQTAMLIRDGHVKNDSEGAIGHLENALTRIAMAIAVLRDS